MGCGKLSKIERPAFKDYSNLYNYDYNGKQVQNQSSKHQKSPKNDLRDIQNYINYRKFPKIPKIRMEGLTNTIEPEIEINRFNPDSSILIIEKKPKKLKTGLITKKKTKRRGFGIQEFIKKAQKRNTHNNKNNNNNMNDMKRSKSVKQRELESTQKSIQDFSLLEFENFSKNEKNLIVSKNGKTVEKEKSLNRDCEGESRSHVRSVTMPQNMCKSMSKIKSESISANISRNKFRTLSTKGSRVNSNNISKIESQNTTKNISESISKNISEARNLNSSVYFSESFSENDFSLINSNSISRVEFPQKNDKRRSKRIGSIASESEEHSFDSNSQFGSVLTEKSYIKGISNSDCSRETDVSLRWNMSRIGSFSRSSSRRFSRRRSSKFSFILSSQLNAIMEEPND